MRIADDAASGWGVWAARDIAEGERVVATPRRLALTARDAPAFLDDDAAAAAHALPPSARIAARLCVEREAGPSAVWWPYIASLPVMDDVPASWSEAECEWLAGSQTGASVASTLERWRRELVVVNRCRADRPAAGPPIKWEAWRWAQTVVQTRELCRRGLLCVRREEERLRVSACALSLSLSLERETQP